MLAAATAERRSRRRRRHRRRAATRTAAADAARARATCELTADEDRLVALHRRRDADRGRRAPAARLAPGLARGRPHARLAARDPVGVLVDAEPPRHPRLVRRRHRDRRRSSASSAPTACARSPSARGSSARSIQQLRAVARALRHRRRRASTPGSPIPTRAQLFDLIAAEHARTVARAARHARHARRRSRPGPTSSPPSRAATRTLDVLSHVQIEALRRRRGRRRRRAPRPDRLHDDRRDRRGPADRGVSAAAPASNDPIERGRRSPGTTRSRGASTANRGEEKAVQPDSRTELPGSGSSRCWDRASPSCGR